MPSIWLTTMSKERNQQRDLTETTPLPHAGSRLPSLQYVYKALARYSSCNP
jgi:hypothetical protein